MKKLLSILVILSIGNHILAMDQFAGGGAYSASEVAHVQRTHDSATSAAPTTSLAAAARAREGKDGNKRTPADKFAAAVRLRAKLHKWAKKAKQNTADWADTQKVMSLQQFCKPLLLPEVWDVTHKYLRYWDQQREVYKKPTGRRSLASIASYKEHLFVSDYEGKITALHIDNNLKAREVGNVETGEPVDRTFPCVTCLTCVDSKDQLNEAELKELDLKQYTINGVSCLCQTRRTHPEGQRLDTDTWAICFIAPKLLVTSGWGYRKIWKRVDGGALIELAGADFGRGNEMTCVAPNQLILWSADEATELWKIKENGSTKLARIAYDRKFEGCQRTYPQIGRSQFVVQDSLKDCLRVLRVQRSPSIGSKNAVTVQTFNRESIPGVHFGPLGFASLGRNKFAVQTDRGIYVYTKVQSDFEKAMKRTVHATTAGSNAAASCANNT